MDDKLIYDKDIIFNQSKEHKIMKFLFFKKKFYHYKDKSIDRLNLELKNFR